MSNSSICILPHFRGLGGPASFQNRLIAGLTARGIEVVYDPTKQPCSTVLVVGGISRLDILWRAKMKKARIVQRLNGMNWIHRKRNTGKKHYIRAEWNNWVLATIRRYFADQIVYQSNFARNWWQTVYHSSPAREQVVYNGVNLQMFHPDGPHERPDDHIRLLLVEGHLRGGYEQGLETAIGLARLLKQKISQPVELMVAGDVSEDLRARWNADDIWINWAGILPGEKIPQVDRSAHLLFSADLNAACPNSVVEALACGLPVIGYATGSLPELINSDAGRTVPYNSNYWNLEPPDINGLANAAVEVIQNQPKYRLAARARAEALFDVNTMVEKYLNALLG